jgi:hypothetical protein
MITSFRALLIVCTLYLSAEGQTVALSANKIIELIPNKFEDYRLNEDPQSKLIAFGTLRYSIAEKNFVGNRQRSIKILLFDFKEAPIMYKQATRKFSTFTPVDSDTLVVRSLIMTDCSGWESFNVKRNFSQILLGVCDRFFLTIEGTNVEINELKRIVQSFKFETYPK